MPRKVLIVDDSAINRQMLANVLKKDYDIIEAENGKEALALMHRNFKMLSAVLLDIVMPEMDGYDVLRAMRDNAILSQLPVIMVTGTENEDARVKALALGANDFIMKPFNPEIIKHCLRNNIAMRENASIINAIQKDKLTGLYNRDAFFDKAGTMIKEQEPGFYVLTCFDIDNFKLINDQYGSIEGDNILREIGQAINTSVNSIGGLVGRISGDNFVTLIPLTEIENDILHQIQQKIPALLEQRYMAFSLGRYVITDTTIPVSALYDRAYIAKQSVKGRFDTHVAYFDETMLENLVRDQEIVSEMEKALRENQFDVWFQPQYSNKSGEIMGAEALVRWNHPKKGIIPPSEFIPLFEKNGFIYEMDKYIWREACRYLREWIDKGIEPAPISVNVSRYDIFRTDMVETLVSYLDEFDIPVDLLRIEITESAFAKNTSIIVDIVKKLVAKGFLIEIDDFGSGYSSLNTLKSVPAQIVKLDMRFLEDGEGEQRGGTILESVVRMAKWLGMSIIAEGVETKEQCDFLKSIGCTIIQGFLYAKPMEAEKYEEILLASRVNPKIDSLETVARFSNDEFWSPESIDSLIFNSYVGSACVLEFFDDKIELIRATDKYAKMLGGEKMTVDQLMNIDVYPYLAPEVAEDVIAQIKASAESMEEVSGEFHFIGIPGCPHDLFIRSNMRVVASTSSRHLIYCISENITAQRIAEKQERRAANQLQVILDSVYCGVTAFLFEPEKTNKNGKGSEAFNFNLVLANDRFYELLGYTREEYNEKYYNNPLGIIYEEDVERATSIAKELIKTGDSASLEYRIIRKDGEVIWIRSLLSMASLDEVEGKVQLCTYVDITAEKNIAKNLLDNLPCGAGICSVQGNEAYMKYLNRTYYTYFKGNVGISESISVFEFIHPDDRDLVNETMRPIFHGGGENSCIARIKDGENDYKYVRLTGSAIKDEHKEILEGEIFENDLYITFVPISYEELSFNEMLNIALERMMLSSPDLAFIKDRNLKYICCTTSFAQMVGLDNTREVIGKTDYDLFEKELADNYIADDRRLMESGTSIIDLVEEIPSTDGRIRRSSTSKYLLTDSRGEIVGLYGVGRDITDLREAEAKREFLINSIPGGVAVYEGKWVSLDSIKLKYFSDGFANIFGYTRDEYEKLAINNPTGLVDPEFLPGFIDQIINLVERNTPLDYIYRAIAKSGKHIWVHVKGIIGEKHDDFMSVNAVFFDVTEHQESLEKLRISEEENRLAISHSNNVVCRYNVEKKTLRVSANIKPMFGLSSIMENVPYGPVKEGAISSETADAYIGFYEKIINGEKHGEVVFQRRTTEGWRWIEAYFSTIFSSNNKPISAVVSFIDVTDTFEKEVAYKKWMTSLHKSDPNSYSLFRCNLSQNKVNGTAEGSLLKLRFKTQPKTIDDYTVQFVKNNVYENDKEAFLEFLNLDSLIERYYAGEKVAIFEFRGNTEDNGYEWIRITVDLVKYPYSNDIEAYLLFENIDDAKRAELLTLERIERDPLTGAYNRATFSQKVNKTIRDAKSGEQHALIMMDIDNFKRVNDNFGHSKGDKILIELVGSIRSVLHNDDFVGRLGGDEILIFMKDIKDEDIAAQKAEEICKLTKMEVGDNVNISGSVGIAVSPRDGINFDILYQKADSALYYVKGIGKDNFAFYKDEMDDEHPIVNPDISGKDTNTIGKRKHRMLIIDDNKIDSDIMANLFKDEFIVEKVKDGSTALIRMRHYGSAISVILLDLLMPGMDGFAVLNEMQKSPELQSIPVVVVSGAGFYDTSLQAIKCGASDFVTKPVDPDVLRIRVLSAISKAENEKLRAKNNFLELKNAEVVRYKNAIEKMGVAVIEMDWGKGTFAYGHSVSKIIWGDYDNRALWHILLSDLVASAGTVKDLQVMVHGLADDRTKMDDFMIAKLKIPTGAKHDFHIHVYKTPDKYGLTDKILITFEDLEKSIIQ